MSAEVEKWRFARDNPHTNRVIVIYSGEDNRDEVSVLYNQETDDRARLICAAPAMHALLVECLANSPERRSDWRERVEAVLAEVRGGP